MNLLMLVITTSETIDGRSRLLLLSKFVSMTPEKDNFLHDVLEREL